MPGFVVITNYYSLGDAEEHRVLAISHRHIETVEVCPVTKGGRHEGWRVEVTAGSHRASQFFLVEPNSPDTPTLGECRAAAFAFAEEITSQTLDPRTVEETNPF